MYIFDSFSRVYGLQKSFHQHKAQAQTKAEYAQRRHQQVVAEITGNAEAEYKALEEQLRRKEQEAAAHKNRAMASTELEIRSTLLAHIVDKNLDGLVSSIRDIEETHPSLKQTIE